MDLTLALPEGVRSLVAGRTPEEVSGGVSGARVIRWTGAGRPSLYLKIDRGDRGDSDAEGRVLRWLWGKVRVPEVLCSARSEGTRYLLMTEVEGVPAHDPDLRKDIPGLMAALAEGMREFHQLSAEGCPFHMDVRRLVRRAEERVETGRVDVDDLSQKEPGRTPNSLLQELLRLAPSGDWRGTTVTHGDFCLPNILVKGGTVSGWIDVGDVSVADPYVDLVRMKFSLRLNRLDGWFSEFVRQCGISRIDRDRFRLYELLRSLA